MSGKSVLWMALLVTISCGGDADQAGGDGAGDDPGVVPSDTSDTSEPDDLLLSDCREGSRWSSGTVAFVDASAQWGLSELSPVGVRVSIADIDNDAWPDLIVRNSTGGEDFADGGTRNTWLLRNQGDGSFEDVTESSGFTSARAGGTARSAPVVVWGDVDNDGDLDAYAGIPDGDNRFPETSEILLNDGSGAFTLGPESSDVRVARGEMPYGAAFLDFDRDGFLDLFVGEYTLDGQPAQDRLFRGDGSGAFAEVTREAGLETEAWSSIRTLNSGLAHTYAWSAAACDLNGDGWPELLSASYGRAPNHLWQNNGGTFSNQSVASGYAYDGREDWSDNESARCWCALHRSDPDCDGVPEPDYISCETDDDAFRWNHSYDREAFRLGGNSGASVCRDIDNDGQIDLLTSEIVHWDVGSSSDPSELLFNTGSAEIAFERPGNDVTGLTRTHSRVTWDDGDITGSVFDFDNDGWPDVYIGSSDYPDTRGLLYHQEAARAFAAVVPEEGIDHTRSHGSAIADFDRDGDLDIVVGHSSMRCEDDCRDTFEVRLFENQMGDDSNWVQLDLRPGAGVNGAAVGARVTVRTESLTQVQEVSGGSGQWGNQDDRLLHFGLGPDCTAEVTVAWPDSAGSEETYTVGSGYRWTLSQGEMAEAIVR
jgi:hypothetical protein